MAKEKSEYLRDYKKYHYSKTRKIITFPLLLDEFELLSKSSSNLGITNNSFAKQIVSDFLHHNQIVPLTSDRVSLIKEYLRVNRGIATNINQIAYAANLYHKVDINILFEMLKKQEDTFKSFIAYANTH
jgi:hypothetical protein